MIIGLGRPGQQKRFGHRPHAGPLAEVQRIFGITGRACRGGSFFIVGKPQRLGQSFLRSKPVSFMMPVLTDIVGNGFGERIRS
jgi:hypothetical protein